MDSALSPRDIQARIRSGASVAEVAEEAGVDAARIEGFALPVIAEREHMARTALSATVRRRGNGTGHRRLSEIISERLRARGMDSDLVEWDAWRLPDLRWRLMGVLEDGAATREAEFNFDPKRRFSVAHNADARWMIGEELPGAQDPDNENTVDFDDELALVRATQGLDPDGASSDTAPGDDIPRQEALYEDPAQTSELDELYDMLSGVSEDSVRIYVGLEDEPADPMAEADPTPVETPAESADTPATDADETDQEPASEVSSQEQPEVDSSALPAPTEPEQDALLDHDEVDAEPAPAQEKPKGSRRRRAQIPSWDEIMFGGPTK